MRKTNRAGLAITLLLGFVSAGVHPEEIPLRGPLSFEMLDKDGNGQISKAEFDSVRGGRRTGPMAGAGPVCGCPCCAAAAAGADAGPVCGCPCCAAAAAGADAGSGPEGNPGAPDTGQSQQMQNACCPGMAQGGRAMRRPDFQEFDLNKDGSILESEFKEARNQRISERAKQGYPMRNLANAPSFTDLDTDGDGKVSSQEFAAHQTRCIR